MPGKKKYERWQDVKRRRLTPAQLERVEATVARELLEMNLRELREALGRSQVELAKLASITQPELSKQERRTDHMVSTLRRLVEALGGELKVVAHFKDKDVELRGV
jgi:DNA-binding transcriptional regulator YiaG